jgi:flavodoxin I
MKSLIIYDSVFGNTEKVALAMGEALGESVQVVKVSDVTPAHLADIDLLVIGSPTRGFRPTEAITNLLKNLPDDRLNEIPAAAFDTRIPPESIESKVLRKVVTFGGYADKKINQLLKRKGAALLPSAGFFVTASEGPLADGEIQRAKDWIKLTAENKKPH